MKYQVMILLMLSGYMFGYNEQHVTILLDRSGRLKQGTLGAEYINISNCDFRESGSLLKGIYLPGITAAGVNFGKYNKKDNISLSQGPTDLTGANLSGVYLGSANFEGCILRNVDFRGSDIIKANFANADLTGAKFKETLNIDLACFRNTIMPNGKRSKSAQVKSL